VNELTDIVTHYWNPTQFTAVLQLGNIAYSGWLVGVCQHFQSPQTGYVSTREKIKFVGAVFL